MSQVEDTPNSRTASDHHEEVNHRSPSTNELCSKLIEEFTNGRILKDEAIQEIVNTFQESDTHDGVSTVQIQMAISTYIAMLDQAVTSRQNAAKRGRAQLMGPPDQRSEDSRGTNRASTIKPNRTPEPETSMGRRIVDEGLFTWTREEDSEVNTLTPSQELTRKLVRNHTVDIKITNTTYSVCEHYLNFLTPNGSRYYRAKQLTSMSSSLRSTPLSQTTKPLSRLETSNYDSDTPNRRSQKPRRLAHCL